MKDDQQDIRKIQITRNYITALEYLIESGRIRTVSEFEEKTGIRQQRISGFKSYLNYLDSGESESGKVKAYYAGIDQILIMNEVFGVSLQYLLYGEKPIFEEDRKSTPPNEFSESNLSKFMFQVREQLKTMEERQNFLKEQVDFLREKLDFFSKR